jgi:hypothetical protein
MLTETLLRISFVVIVRTFSSVDLSLTVTGGFQYDFTELQAASCKHFWVKIAASGFLKRVTGSISKLVSNFKGAG